MIIAEHSVDIGRLPVKAKILDLGCSDMKFNEYFTKRKCRVYSLDLDNEAPYKIAISTKNGRCGVDRKEDRQAWKMKEGDEIKMMTIKTFSDLVQVKHWDLIKMDIEGEEYNILWEAEHPIADQVSVEFHAHLGYPKSMLDKLILHLSRWYHIRNDDWEERHGAGFNYWDVLFIAK